MNRFGYFILTDTFAHQLTEGVSGKPNLLDHRCLSLDTIVAEAGPKVNWRLLGEQISKAFLLGERLVALTG